MYYPIVKGVIWNRRPIQNCTSFYQMKLRNVSSALIIGSRPFVFIKVYISIDPIDYLLCNQRKLHLIDKDIDKTNRPQFIWSYFYWIILLWKDTRYHYSSEFIWEIFPLEWREWWFDEILLQFPEYYNSIPITDPH